MAQGMDFLASVERGSSPVEGCDFLPAARSQHLGNPSRQSSNPQHWKNQLVVQPAGKEASWPQDGRGFVDGFASWCQGVVDHIEHAVQTGAKQQESFAKNLTSMPVLFGTCVPKIRGGRVAIAATSSSALPLSGGHRRLSTTVALAKAAAESKRRERTGKADADCDDEDVASQRVMPIAHLRTSRLGEAVLAMANSAALGLGTFFATGPRAAELRAATCGAAATLLMPFASGGAASAASAGGPVMAFCPLDFGCFGDKGFSLSECAPMRELSLQELEKGVLVATFVQGSLGLLRVCLGDVFSGSYALLLATLGYNSRRPGPSSNWLKTYVLITFINGTMSCIDLVQNILIQNYPVIMPALPFAVNAAHLVTLTVPWVSFLGAYCGWQHIKMQRKIAVKAYQEQIMMLMEQPPWPPPPLPFPLPGMPGIQMVEDGDDARQMPPGWQPFPGSHAPGRLAPVIEEEVEATEAPESKKRDD